MALDQRDFAHGFLSKFDGKIFMYRPMDKNDLVCGCCICDRCNTKVREFYYTCHLKSATHSALCVNCVLELNPPKWQIIIGTVNQPVDNRIEPIGNYHIWDETHKRQETSLTLGELIECGWFIRKVTETPQRVPNRIVKKIDLEYHGELACIRFKDHYEKLGLGHISKCHSPFCEFVYERIHNPLNKLPNYRRRCYW